MTSPAKLWRGYANPRWMFSASVDEARNSVEILTNVVHQVLESNQDILSRIGSLEGRSMHHRDPRIIGGTEVIDDGTSTIVPDGIAESAATQIQDISFAFSFDEDLSSSRVYSRARRRRSAESLRSSAVFSFGWSCLSDLSLGDVSEIPVISLPIDINEIPNRSHYSSKPLADLRTTLHPRPIKADPLGKYGENKNSIESGGSDCDIASLLSSSPSIDDENIDSGFVYALRTFIATGEGQISVTKGDVLALLDDSASPYWWLVKLVQDGSLGNVASGCHVHS